LLVHIGDPSSNQATTLESQMIHMIQELFGRTLKTCGGKGTTIACPNFRSHKLHNLLKFGRILPKRLALF
jgi:hypothetical protein